MQSKMCFRIGSILLLLTYSITAESKESKRWLKWMFGSVDFLEIATARKNSAGGMTPFSCLANGVSGSRRPVALFKEVPR